MKKVFTLMLGLVAGTASFAQQAVPQTPTSAITQTRLVATPDQKLKLFVQPQAAKGHIMLQDAQGHALYTANVALQKGLGQQFDIADLGVGTYRLTVSTGTETITKTFVVQSVPNQTFVILPA